MAAPPSPSAARAPLARGEFIALMALLMALQALATDAMLPAIGTMARELGESDPNRRQLVIGVFLLASGCASLLPGTLADRVGRRPLLLGGLTAYILLSLACAAVGSFLQLLALRAALGLACSFLVVLPGTIVRDRFSGDAMARISSTVSAVFMVVPILAPSVGQLVLLVAGWRWIFAVLGAMGVALLGWSWARLPETLRPEYRHHANLLALAANMATVARNWPSLAYVTGSALMFGAMLGYINSAQQLVAEHFGAGRLFPLLFALTALGMAAASLTNARIVERFGARRVSHSALLAFIGTGAVQLWFATRAHESLWQFMPLMAANMALLSFIGANFSSIALQPFAGIAGAASSLHAFLRMVLGAGVGIVIGQAFDGSARPLALALLGSGCIALVLVLLAERGRLFRRLLPPGTPRLRPDPGMP